jgi:hypothetical protein
MVFWPGTEHQAKAEHFSAFSVHSRFPERTSDQISQTFLIFLLVYAFVVYVLPILLGLGIVIWAFVYGRRLLRRWRLRKSRWP